MNDEQQDLQEINSISRKLDTLIERSGYPQRWLNLKSAAHYCGLSQDTLHNLMNAGKLTKHKPVDVVLVDRVELDSLIQASTSRSRKGRGQRRKGDLCIGTRMAHNHCQTQSRWHSPACYRYSRPFWRISF